MQPYPLHGDARLTSRPQPNGTSASIETSDRRISAATLGDLFPSMINEPCRAGAHGAHESGHSRSRSRS